MFITINFQSPVNDFKCWTNSRAQSPECINLQKTILSITSDWLVDSSLIVSKLLAHCNGQQLTESCSSQIPHNDKIFFQVTDDLHVCSYVAPSPVKMFCSHGYTEAWHRYSTFRAFLPSNGRIFDFFKHFFIFPGNLAAKKLAIFLICCVWLIFRMYVAFLFFTKGRRSKERSFPPRKEGGWEVWLHVKNSLIQHHDFCIRASFQKN